jgi:ABC-type multidrug transport system fused ATPase/permease subunit
MSNHIDIKNIIFGTIVENTNIFFSVLTLLLAYWLQDVIFPNTFSKFTSNIPEFINNMNFRNVMNIIYPFIIAEILFYINNIIVSHKVPAMELAVVKKITDQILDSVKTTKKQINTNELIMNLKKVLETRTVYHLIVSNILPFILISIGFIYSFTKANVKMGIISLIIISIFILTTLYFQKSSVQAACDNEDAINMFYDNIQDVMINSDTVITSNTKNKEMENLNIDGEYVKDKYITREIKAAENTFGLHIFAVIVTLVLDAIAIKMYTNNNIPIDALISICLISITFMKYFNSAISKFRNSIGFVGKFYEIQKYFSEFKINDEKDKNLIVRNADIEFSNITLKYGDKVIIKNFNHKIKGRTKIGIIGNIGCGKTSLMKMISGLIEYEGTIYIDGQDLKLCNYDSILNNIVYISQHPKMFNKTILYNIAYGTNYNEKDVNEFLKMINFYDFFQQFEGGLQSKVGKEGSKLSGGQKQIIAIIRSLLQNKSIILLDEPTSSLDPDTKKSVIGLLKNITGKTILIVTHDQSLYDLFDDYVIMK